MVGVLAATWPYYYNHSFSIFHFCMQRPALPATHRSSCRSGPRPGTHPAPPEPWSSAGPHSRWCRRRTGSGSCSSSASPRSWWSPSAHRSRPSSRRWGSRGGPGRSPAGSCCLHEEEPNLVISRGLLSHPSLITITAWTVLWLPQYQGF